MLSEPCLGFCQITSEDDGIAVLDIVVCLSGGCDIQVKELVDKQGQRFCAIRALRDCEVQVGTEMNVGILCEKGADIPFGVFLLRQLV